MMVDKRIKRYLNDTFKRLGVDEKDLDKIDIPGSRAETRAVAVLSVLKAQKENLFPRELYELIGINLKQICAAGWFVENLLPIPIISIPSKQFNKNCIKRLYSLNLDEDKNLRLTIASGEVIYGTIGKGDMFACGSIGGIMNEVIEMNFQLSSDYSWADEGTFNQLQMDSLSKEKVGSSKVYFSFLPFESKGNSSTL